MVSLDVVRASNAQLRELGPGLVALFVGGTSGIGEFTLKAFVQNTISPRVYLVGRNETAAERIINECEVLNKEGKVEFFKADVRELGDVDRVCKEIEKRESKINLVFQTQGNMDLKGRNESSEGLDRKFSLNYYSRMRFIYNLLPLLRNATTSAPNFSRSVSVLGPGNERDGINLADIDLKNTFTPRRCAAHTIVMNDFMTENFATREPGSSFIHTSPGVVNTGIARELPLWAKAAVKITTPLLSLMMTSAEETGQRQLFAATSAHYSPAKPASGAAFASGVPVPKGLGVATGSDGQIGSGGYLVDWNGEITGKTKVLSDLREKGVAKTIWEHTVGTFERVEKLNQAKVPFGF